MPFRRCGGATGSASPAGATARRGTRPSRLRCSRANRAANFPKPDPANFTATTPSRAIVDAFLNTSWGYDESRIWQVEAILKTQEEGFSKVIVFVGDKNGKDKPFRFPFIVLPDGKHMIFGEDIYPFGDHPYAEHRAMMQERADGPYRGSAAKDLEIVEFADLQCPHCKAAQANMDQLAVDFPKARIVFQNYPLPMHPEAHRAADFGACVAKQGGSSAFFTYVSSVFDGQDGLATPDGATLTLNAAVTKAWPGSHEDCRLRRSAGNEGYGRCLRTTGQGLQHQ